MSHPQLRSTTDIELASTDFQTDNHEQAAEEIEQFYEDGVRTFVEMEELGEWSRSLYQQVYKKYFRAYSKNGISEPEQGDLRGDDIPTNGGTAQYRQGYRDGYSDAVDDLLERILNER